MQNDGWVKLSRKMLEWQWFSKPNYYLFFSYCILRANYKDTKIGLVKLKRGEFMTSSESLCKNTGLSRQETRTIISNLKLTGEITTRSTNKFTIITVCNYDTYQDLEKENNQQTNQQINQQSTSNQPTTNQRATTDKNTKNLRIEESKEILIEGVSSFGYERPTQQQISDFVFENNLIINPIRFFNYYDSRGWKLSGELVDNWRSLALSWNESEKERGTNGNSTQGNTKPLTRAEKISLALENSGNSTNKDNFKVFSE